MEDATCPTCDSALPPHEGRGRPRVYCSRSCAAKAQRRRNPRTCSVDGCDSPHGARGYCYPHYGAWHRRENGRKSNGAQTEITCIVCGSKHLSWRADGKFCSDQCKGDHYRTRTTTRLPKNHPVMQLQRPVKRPASPRPKPTQRQAECEWCGAGFSTTVSTKRMCSTDCKVRAKRVRRRGRQAGSSSHYTWTEVMRLFLAFDRCCAYCEQPIIGQPDPDHVVPLSKGGSNSITNVLPACRLCNSDKRDLLLIEWAADRERRGLAPVVTTWRRDDPRLTHLTSVTLAA